MSLAYLSQKELIDIANLVYLSLDTDFNIEMINQKGCDLFGFTEDEIIGKNWFDTFFQKKTAKELKQKYRKLINVKEKQETLRVDQIYTKSRELKTISWKCRTIQNENGDVIGLYSSVDDTTKQVTLEKIIKQTEEKYNTLFEISGTAIGIANLQGFYTLVNSNFEKITGFEKNEIIDKKHWKEFIPKSEYSCLEEIKDVINKDEDYSAQYESKIITKSSEIRNVIINIEYISKQREIITVFSDITELKKKEQLARESEEKYKKLVEVIPEAIILSDLEGEILYANNNAAKIFSFNRLVDFERLNIKYLFHENSINKYEKNLADILHENEIDYTEYQMIRKNGIKFPLEVKLKLITDINNTPIAIMTIGRDLTEEKKLEQELKEKERLSNNILDNSFQLTWLLLPQGNIINVNKTALDFVNVKEEDVIGVPIWETSWWSSSVHEQDKMMEAVDKAAKGNIVKDELLIIDKEDNIRTISFSLKPLHNQEGKITYLISEGQDITEKKIAENNLKASEVLYKTLFENTGTGVFLADDDYTILLCNNSFEKMCGYSEKELQGKVKLMQLIKEEEQVEFFEILNNRSTKKCPAINYETIMKTRDGELIHVLISICEIPKTKQTIVSVLDITERKLLEGKQKRSENKLKYLVENMPIAISILSQSFGIVSVNSAYWKLFGYNSKNEYLVSDNNDFWIDTNRKNKLFEMIQEKNFIRNFETKLQKKDKSSFWASISLISFKDIIGEISYFQIIEDISTKKKLEEKLIYNKLDYKIEEAHIYMIEEERAFHSKEIFEDLLKVGYNGIYFSREIEKQLRNDLNKNCIYYKFSEKGSGNIVPPNLKKIEQIIEKLPNRCVVFIDRLDYLIQKNGFESTLFFIYKLMDIVFLNNNIILVSVDTTTMNPQEKKLLEKELKQLNNHKEELLPEEHYQLLKFIYQTNITGSKPTISDIITKLKISRPTARKRIVQLMNKDFIVEKTSGRSKLIEITPKGKSIF